MLFDKANFKLSFFICLFSHQAQFLKDYLNKFFDLIKFIKLGNSDQMI